MLLATLRVDTGWEPRGQATDGFLPGLVLTIGRLELTDGGRSPTHCPFPPRLGKSRSGAHCRGGGISFDTPTPQTHGLELGKPENSLCSSLGECPTALAGEQLHEGGGRTHRVKGGPGQVRCWQGRRAAAPGSTWLRLAAAVSTAAKRTGSARVRPETGINTKCAEGQGT